MQPMKRIIRLSGIGCLLILLGGTGVVGISRPAAAQESSAPASQGNKDLDFADGLFQRGMYENAAEQYSQFLENDPASPLRELALFRQGESYYQLAAKKLKQDSVPAKIAFLQARAAFQEWLRLFPKGKRILEVSLRYGEISYKLDEASKGLEPLQRVIRESQDPVLLETALFYAARCHEALGQDDEALARYRQILSTYPKGQFTAFSTFLLGEVLVRKGKREEAIAYFDALWKNPSNYSIPEGSNLIADSQLRSAQLLYQMDRFEEASQSYMAYVKDHPTGEAAAKARYGAAWAEYQRKNYEGALEIAHSLQRESLPPELLAGILFLNGTCSYQQKSYDEAILYFREVIADPHAGDYRERAWYQLAWSYYLSNDFKAAIAECENLLRQGLPSEMGANVHFLVGQSYAQLQNYEEAIQKLQLCLQLAPSGEYAEESTYLMADLLYRTQQYKKAGDSFERFYKVFPQSPRAQEALMWAVHSRFADKEFDSAIKAADRLLAAYPNLKTKADVLYRKALAQYQIKDYKNALETLNAILNLSGGEHKSEALYWRAYIFDIQNDKQKAAETYEALLERYPDFPNRDEVQLRKALCDYDRKDYGVAFEGFYAILFTDRGARLPAEILFWMVVTADERELHEDALEIAQRIQVLFESNAPICERASIAAGNQLIALGRWKDALNNAAAFLKDYPESLFLPEIYWTRAKALEQLGEEQQALEWYEKSLNQMQKLGNPDYAFEANLFMDRGRLLQRLGRTGDALESFLRVAIIFDHPQLTPEALYRSIQCHDILKENKEALTLWDELQTRYPDSSWAKKAKTDFETMAAPTTSNNESSAKN
ncbi:MAG: tetratricopeptide repeat protein [Candidatus Omnitrophica bacterium]|nr:tetratricopeptide repeat protein [Candidatus Omnitrophota bacterium]